MPAKAIATMDDSKCYGIGRKGELSEEMDLQILVEKNAGKWADQGKT